ncbi:hypothetical protein C8F04DRAFT_1145986 [Mycena alexandri]|uniref:Uncharacterized protein n=1 Tax=Mycena alexandri TaxID=1745969 RepID=A0AAD6S6E0_9AGAR|nr:hypothetical protein C8F04DRAFT_1145986 [Mycena alexandri]
MWIRTSTGRLSVDPPTSGWLHFTSATVNIGAVISWPSGHQYDENAEIALLPGVDVKYSSWRRGRAENGWSCCRADDVLNTEISLEVYSYYPEGWLSQANLVFSRLQITSNLEDYVFISHISFTLAIGRAGEDPPPGYLFLCPREDFRTGPSSFSWPKCPAYWSLDPEGIEALSTEEAARLGFPSFQLATDVQGSSWDASVYPGLRKFHQAKGFDPDSQEVALHLGHPLYQLSGDVNAPLAYVPALEESPMFFSRGFRVTMMVQLMLIFSLSLFSLYEQLF